MKSSRNLFFIVLTVVFVSCKKDGSTKTYQGIDVSVGNGTVHTFITKDKNDHPLTIGIKMSTDALNGLPTQGDPNMGGELPGYMLNLPEHASNSGFNHSEVDWNPHGHEPLFAYGVPHFDFHFYMITPEEQSQVIPGPDTIPVDPKYIPQNYVSGMMAVPDMGTHWVDTTSAEFHGQPFTITFIYGFYHGEMTFLEPMISKAFLDAKPDVTLPIKQPQTFQKHGYYPAKVHLYFDDHDQQYVIALEGLTYK
jgi:hypothetical protein